MNKGNTVCMEGVLQSPLIDPDSLPPDALETPVPQEPVFCAVNSLVLSCGHGERAFMPDLMAQDVPLLQVISPHHKPDKLIVSANSLCGFAHPFCPSVLISPEKRIDWKPIDPTAGVELPPNFDAPVAVGMIERMLFGHWPHETYKVRPMICNGANKAEVPINVWTTVEVYNEMEWKGDLTLGWAHPPIDKKQPCGAAGQPDRSEQGFLQDSLRAAGRFRSQGASPELAEALRAGQTGIEVVCAATPEIDAVFAAMRERMNER